MNDGQAANANKSNTTLIIVVVIVGVLLLMCCGVVSLLVAIFVPAMSTARERAREMQAMAQLRQASIALTMYSAQWDAYPPAGGWISVATNAGPGQPPLSLVHPLTPTDGRAFAMNDALTLRNMDNARRPSQTVLLFECVAGSPAVGGKDLLPSQPRGGSGYLIAFIDGSTRAVPPHEIDSLVWGVTNKTGEASSP